ncbi:unnamed protein product [Closterium sp. Yama58-4]|nr:unnamed protein product [Closterium sp. Yama58-4]
MEGLTAQLSNTGVGPASSVRASASVSIRSQVASTSRAALSPCSFLGLRRRILPTATPRIAERLLSRPSLCSKWRLGVSAASAASDGGSSAYSSSSPENAGQVAPKPGVAGQVLPGSATESVGTVYIGDADAAAATSRASRHRPGQMEFVPGQKEFRPTRNRVLAMAAVALLLFLNRRWLLSELICSSLLILSLFTAACGSTAVFLVFLAHSLLLLLPDPILTPLSILLSLIASGAEFLYFAALAQFDVMPVGPVILNSLLVTAVVTVAQRFDSDPERLNGPLWLAGSAAVGLATGVVRPLVFLVILTILTGFSAARAILSSSAEAAAASAPSSTTSSTSSSLPSATTKPQALAGPNWLSVVAPAVAAIAGAAESLVVRLLAVGVYAMLAVWLHHSGRITFQSEPSSATAAAQGKHAKIWKLQPMNLIQGLVAFAGLVAVMRWGNSAFLAWMVL